ncbi:MAG: hypothetical protein J2P49_04395 [Methylocapsa sp.]|nr:hypothetical protein [Methylocapsa sp.]
MKGTVAKKSLPYLPLPLTCPEGKIADTDAVRRRLIETHHLRIQANTGLSKTVPF